MHKGLGCLRIAGRHKLRSYSDAKAGEKEEGGGGEGGTELSVDRPFCLFALQRAVCASQPRRQSHGLQRKLTGASDKFSNKPREIIYTAGALPATPPGLCRARVGPPLLPPGLDRFGERAFSVLRPRGRPPHLPPLLVGHVEEVDEVHRRQHGGGGPAGVQAERHELLDGAQVPVGGRRNQRARGCAGGRRRRRDFFFRLAGDLVLLPLRSRNVNDHTSELQESGRPNTSKLRYLTNRSSSRPSKKAQSSSLRSPPNQAASLNRKFKTASKSGSWISGCSRTARSGRAERMKILYQPPMWDKRRRRMCPSQPSKAC